MFEVHERNNTVDEFGETIRNKSNIETVRYLQEDRLFLLRDYDILSEQVEVNIVISPTAKLLLDLAVVRKGEYVSMKMNLNRWKSYIAGGFNGILGLTDEEGNATISNSVYLQVFKFGNNKRSLWKELSDDFEEAKSTRNYTCATLQDCKKDLADHWGLIQLNIPSKNCSVVEFESLSR